jgi:hypothetical protein
MTEEGNNRIEWEKTMRTEKRSATTEEANNVTQEFRFLSLLLQQNIFLPKRETDKGRNFLPLHSVSLHLSPQAGVSLLPKLC